MPPLMFPLEEVWQKPLDDTPATALAFDETHAYVPEANGHLAAYALVTGEVLWQVALAPTIAPVTGGGQVFVATAHALAALDARDGHELWREPLEHPLVSALTWDTGWLVGGTADGELLVWRARDGALLWHLDLGAPMSAAASIGGTRVYVPLTDGRLVCLDLTSGRRFWTDRLGGPPTEALPLGDWLFVGSDDNSFYCLSTETGDQRWRWRTGADIIGAAVVDEQRVYFVSLDGLLRALDRASGRLQWQSPLAIRPATGPMMAGRSLMVAGVDPTIPAYLMTTGEAEGGVKMGGELAAPPHVTPWGFTIGPSLIVVTRSRTGEPQIQALARSLEPALAPFTELPGTTLTGH